MSRSRKNLPEKLEALGFDVEWDPLVKGKGTATHPFMDADERPLRIQPVMAEMTIRILLKRAERIADVSVSGPNFLTTIKERERARAAEEKRRKQVEIDKARERAKKLEKVHDDMDREDELHEVQKLMGIRYPRAL